MDQLAFAVCMHQAQAVLLFDLSQLLVYGSVVVGLLLRKDIWNHDMALLVQLLFPSTVS